MRPTLWGLQATPSCPAPNPLTPSTPSPPPPSPWSAAAAACIDICNVYLGMSGDRMAISCPASSPSTPPEYLELYAAANMPCQDADGHLQEVSSVLKVRGTSCCSCQCKCERPHPCPTQPS